MLTSYYFGKTIETLRLAIKNNAILLQASEISLEEYKTANLKATLKKQLLLKLQIWIKKYFSAL